MVLTPVCFGRWLLIGFILGCLFCQLRLHRRRALLWGDALHPTLDYDSPLMRIHWHHPSTTTSERWQRHRNRILMIQYFPSLNYSIWNRQDGENVDDGSHSSQQQQRQQHHYTSQVNQEYAEKWGYEYLLIMGTVNQTQSLLEIFDALQDQNDWFGQLLLLPHEGIILHDFVVDVASVVLEKEALQEPQKRTIVYHQSRDSCPGKNSNGSDETPGLSSYHDLLWNEGMTFWKLSHQNSKSLPTLIRHMLSATSTESATTTSLADSNNKIRLACFPENMLGRVYCDRHRNPSSEASTLISWFNYSSPPRHLVVNDDITTTRHKKQQPRLLIGQYSGHGIYGKLLNVTSQISRHYCRKWSCDVLVVQGKHWTVPPLDDFCPSPAHRASFTKISILKMVLDNNDAHPRAAYDQLLLLDADAFVYDWDFDITDLLTKMPPPVNLNGDNNNNNNNNQADTMPILTAHKVKRKSSNYTWNINNGVTLWNLRHPKTRSLVNHWDRNAVDRILDMAWTWRQRRQSVFSSSSKIADDDVPGRISDQHTLHKTIRQLNLSTEVYGSRNVLEYENGTVVKHLIRVDNNQWGNIGDSEYRLMALKRYAQELCDRYPSDCIEEI